MSGKFTANDWSFAKISQNIVDFQGDSGGLITCGGKNELTGVVSFGDNCGVPEFPGIFFLFYCVSFPFLETSNLIFFHLQFNVRRLRGRFNV